MIHVGSDSPSISDKRVLEIACEENRILLTFDKDHGQLIFAGKVSPPPEVVYFRLQRYHPELPGKLLVDLIAQEKMLEGFFTVVKATGVKKRAL